jgi:hypothetical protein
VRAHPEHSRTTVPLFSGNPFNSFIYKEPGQAIERLPWFALLVRTRVRDESYCLRYAYPIQSLSRAECDPCTESMAQRIVRERRPTYHSAGTWLQRISGRCPVAPVNIFEDIGGHRYNSICGEISHRNRNRLKSHAACVAQSDIDPPAVPAQFRSRVRSAIVRYRRGCWRRREDWQGGEISCYGGVLSPQPAESIWLTGVADVPVVPVLVPPNHFCHLADQ